MDFVKEMCRVIWGIKHRLESSPVSPEFTQNQMSGIPTRLSTTYYSRKLKEQKVLDLGCNDGHLLRFFGPGSIGIDINEEYLLQARSKGLQVIKGNINDNLDFVKDEDFDVVWASHIIEHTRDPHAFLVRLRKKLKANGLLLLGLPLIPKYQIYRLLWKKLIGMGGWNNLAHYYIFTFDTISFTVEKAGFKIINVSLPPLKNRLFVRLFVNCFSFVLIEARKDEKQYQILQNAINRNHTGQMPDP